ncbi:linear amide C-N hydrolase [Archangium violaceum]|uniref:linear amide C-N hydrolase n=1 Tax=Archangium violaceum TaxID=83451 RepID=UPI0036D87F7A
MCTDFLIQSSDGAWVNGRSMEFGQELHTKLYVQAPKQKAVLRGLAGEEFESTPDYGYVGTSAMDLPVVTDGLNTAGLSTGALWLPGTQYQSLGPLPTKNVFSGFFVNWMLSHCATTDDVRHALESGAVRVIGSEWVAKVGPLHFPVHDARGNSIVIEFLEGKPVISENPVAVLTNQPTFPWHLENLRNYVNLSPMDSPWGKDNNGKVGNLPITQTGHGTGLSGLPGNATPPSRFVRTAFLKQFALQPKTAEEAAVLAFHLLNCVDIPKGTVGAKTLLGKDEYDYTQWVVVKDVTNRILNVRVYGSPLTWSVDLKNLDFTALNGKQLPIPTGKVALPLPA